MEYGTGISEDLRCKRSDGKQWRCSALSMPDKTVCEKHYIQAKRRAASSAMRANEKKAKRKLLSAAAVEDAGMDASAGSGRGDDLDVVGEASVSTAGGSGGGGEYAPGPSPVRRRKERAHRGQGLYGPEVARAKGESSARSRCGEEAQKDLMQDGRLRLGYATPQTRKATQGFGGSGPEDYPSRSTDSSGETEGLTCHQCQRNDRARVVRCMSCAKRGYCKTCVLRRYPDMSMEDIRRVCPACRGICNCRVCLRGDNLIKDRICEMASIDKLRHLHRLLFFLLPVLKQIHSEQCYELDLEIRVYGFKNDILRAKLNPDEQMCCDSCKIPIFDYHRHCKNCLYDLCLTCCRDLRQASFAGLKGESAEYQAVDRSRDIRGAQMFLELFEKIQSGDSLKHYVEDYTIDFTHLFPKWKANSDNSIPCPPSEAGACGNSTLVLRHILKINWVAKLVKYTEEIVNGCKTSDLESTYECTYCTRSITSQSNHSSNLELYQCSQREGSDNFLYCPALQDIEHENIGHFHKHWVKGEPVIVRHAFEPSLSACWDPMSIWRGIQEIIDDGTKDDVIVKATNCSNQSEVDIELRQFIKGYMDGCISQDGQPEILKLKDWPPTNAVEDFLLCQRPEFLSKLPLLEYFHSKWGLLNLAAKLPQDSMQSDIGPKILITCGMHEEFGGLSMANFQINMADVVYLLMHTSEARFQGQWNNKPGSIWRKDDASDMKEQCVKNEMVNSSISTTAEHCTNNQTYGLSLNGKDDDLVDGNTCNGIEIAGGKNGIDFCHKEKCFWVCPEKASAGAVWDVFRRQDVPKLNEYLRLHWKELRNSNVSQIDMVKAPVYEHGFFLDGVHKKKLKDELGVEPWSFQQHIGEAVFIPAGCPFQVRNNLSTVQLCLDFLSPESLAESFRMAQEIRCLPSYHDAKLQMLEVGKMCLYAASSAIREIQKIILDPKLASEIMFEDKNLTSVVSQNLERITKRRQIACI